MSEPVEGGLPEDAYAVALASLANVGPNRLDRLLRAHSPSHAWALVCEGRHSAAPAELAESWAAMARVHDVGAHWEAMAAAGIAVLSRSSCEFPAVLAEDPEPPALLYVRGDLSLLEGPRVAIVGTRNATQYGRSAAREFGHALASMGVGVISGLALGVDACAHRGALEAGGPGPAVAVVGSGLDVVYPAANCGLWQQVAETGVLLSEAPPGAKPDRWRFPARNRLLAALADVVVVVESRERGGSLLTVDCAVQRGRPVLAVPGPIRSEASVGTNRLLGDVALPACDVTDVLVALSLTPAAALHRPGRRPAPDATEARVLDALGWQPATLEDLLARTAMGIGELAVVTCALVESGWLQERGGWFERVGDESPPAVPRG